MQVKEVAELLKKGKSFAQRTKFREAIAYYDRALTLDPGTRRAYSSGPQRISRPAGSGKLSRTAKRHWLPTRIMLMRGQKKRSLFSISNGTKTRYLPAPGQRC